jgi:hypothetical protein
VLDAALRPVPIGVAGELCIAGVGLARGYVNRPELTAERFVSVQLPDGSTPRVYRTGDLARWTADGVLDYLGRSDHQVKIRGFRIELGDVEAALMAHPAVRDVVVVAQALQGDDRQLFAYVVSDGLAPDVLDESLRAHLAACLPDYMLPSAFIGCRGCTVGQRQVDRRRCLAPAAQPVRRNAAPTELALAGISGCLRCLGSVRRTTSSGSAAARCWHRVMAAIRAPRWWWRWASAPCSDTRPWRGWRPPSTQHGQRPSAASCAGAANDAEPTDHPCRMPSVCGCTRRWNPGPCAT